MRKELAIFIIAAAPCLSAQDLSTEITVERTIVPQRELSSPLQSVEPAVLGTEAPAVRLDPDELSDIPPYEPRPGFSDLQPPVRFSPSPYRGYALAGYLPAHNYNFMAGYSILNSDRTTLDAQVGVKGYSYSGWTDMQASKSSLLQPSAHITFFHSFATHTLLELKAGGTYDRLSDNPRLGADLHHGITRGWLDGRLTAVSGNHRLAFDLNAHHIGIGDAVNEYPTAYSSIFLIRGEITPKGSQGWEGAIAGGVQLRRGMEPTGYDFTSQTVGQVRLTPGYRLALGIASLRVGLNVDMTLGGNDRGSFHFSPEVKFAMSPLTRFHVEASVTGGNHFSSPERCYRYSPFATGQYMFSESYTPVDARVALTFGPWDHGKLKVYGRYSQSNDVPMPMVMRGLMTWETVKLSGFSGGAELELKPISALKATAGIEFHQQGYEYGTPENVDRAKVVLKADLTARITDRIHAGVGYHLRSGRAFFYTDPTSFGQTDAGDISDLRVHADWRVLDPLTVFFTLDNLLNKHAEILPQLRTQGFHGLVGAIYRF